MKEIYGETKDARERAITMTKADIMSNAVAPTAGPSWRSLARRQLGGAATTSRSRSAT